MRLNKVIFALVLLFSLLNTTNIFAQKLIVSNYKHHPTDISAREYEVMDINDEPCALIKIYTGFKGLKVDGNRGVEKQLRKMVLFGFGYLTERDKLKFHSMATQCFRIILPAA